MVSLNIALPRALTEWLTYQVKAMIELGSDKKEHVTKKKYASFE